jgi:hypothetical protein
VERVLVVGAHSLDGKKIDPKHATPKSKSKANKTKKIFVGGVSQARINSSTSSFYFFLKRGCLGWGANPGPLEFIYFLNFHRFTAEPQRLPNSSSSSYSLSFCCPLFTQARSGLGFCIF